MRRLPLVLLCALALLIALPVALAPSGPHPNPPPSPVPPHAFDLSKLPLVFEPNVGQTDPAVQFLAHSARGRFFFTAEGVVIAVDTPVTAPPAPVAGPHTAAPAPATRATRLQFLGANRQAALHADAVAQGRVNYLLGDDPAQWHTGLPTYGALSYQSLYPGIDLRYTGTAGQLKGTYTVAPGHDPAAIRWRYQGARSVTVDGAGNLQVTLDPAPAGQLIEQAPVAWQMISDQRVDVAVRYALAPDGSVGFAFGAYDPGTALIIDPVLTYSSYLGGNGLDTSDGITVDAQGNIYLTGWTGSSNFSLVNPYQSTYGGGTTDAFVVKLDPTGSNRLYATYLGGSGADSGVRVRLDSQANISVVGFTNSTDFPRMAPIQASYGGGTNDGFITKLNPTGSALLYSTYLGGNDSDKIFNIAFDAQDNVYVVGETNSTNFPRVNAYQPVLHGWADAFVARLNAGGSTLIYSTYYGGNDGDGGYGLTVDASGNAYIAGIARSANLSLVNPYQPAFGGGSYDAYVARFSPDGSSLTYATYLGGSGNDVAEGIALDTAGNIYLTGWTSSTNFPRANALQVQYGGGTYDAFLTNLTANGASLVYSTYLGGSGEDAAYALAVDGAGKAYIAGYTTSDNFPVTDPVQPTYGGGTTLGDAFLAMVHASGTAVGYATYLGGADDDASWDVAIDSGGGAYITGVTNSTNFPLAGTPVQGIYGGSSDGYVARISNPSATPTATQTATATSTAIATDTPAPTGTATDTPAPTSTATTITTPTATSTPTQTSTPTTTPVPTVCTTQFNDVGVEHPFYPYIRCLACQGIISGYTCGAVGEPCPGNCFRPYAFITRGQAAKIIAISAGITETIPSTQQTFEDVPPGHPFWLPIEQLAEQGMINGYDCGGPGEPCD
ncbi:MAG TPA: SBBP repeat-containing protein, partial [Chloroflexia bacterium]|nr:SBBP repeat-containing protein [Chloroflexia bacterium]